MSNDDETDEVSGTANNNKQHRLYRHLCDLYTPEGASFIASADLKRNGEDVEPREFASWDKITRLNHAGKMDLEAATAVAVAKVNAFTDSAMGRNQVTPALAAQPASTTAEVGDEEWEDKDDAEDDEDDEEDEGSVDFGYDNAEENAEARLDYIHKLNDM